MRVQTNGGSPVVHLQTFQTVPTAVIHEAEQRDRYLKQHELKELSSFFRSGAKRLEIAAILTQNADQIVAAGANRIFTGGSPMAYLEKPEDPVGMPGSGYYVAEDYLSAESRQGNGTTKTIANLQEPRYVDSSNSFINWVRSFFAESRPVSPNGFRAIDISTYGSVRMRRSLRDLSWFLRYITYAIVAGDTSILSINVRGLRGVIPDDVTLATIVALREMQWKAVNCLQDAEAAAVVRRYFDILITDYQVEKPPSRARPGVSNHHQGLQLPQSYFHEADRTPKLVMKSGLSETEKQETIRAAYRQVFERDVTQAYGISLAELESQVKSGMISMKEFVRHLGKSRLYRQQFYEPFAISRIIELAFRHFLGRGISCIEEFQDYFEVISDGGLPALVDALVDSQEYADYFGEETVPYLRGLGQDAQECRNWGPQLDLFKYSAPVRKVPQFITTFGHYQKPLPNQHPYGVGNDPLEIQFGAIFPQESRNPSAQPAHFSTDSRRILISSGANSGNGHALNGVGDFGRIPGSLEHRVLKVSQNPMNGEGDRPANQGNHHQAYTPNVDVYHHSMDAIIHGAYRQVFGRDVFDGQRQTNAEIGLKGGELTMREFVRQLAKSRPFRNLYWDNLYITKAIEYIHRRLLGRPTVGRQELNQYYDICARKGFYALVDAIIDSSEYSEVFGEDTVPYERYLTPRGYALRSPKGPVGWSKPRENPPIAGEWMMTHPMMPHQRMPQSTTSAQSGVATLEASNSPDENNRERASVQPVASDGHQNESNPDGQTELQPSEPPSVPIDGH
ncbi:MAG: phycobilisome rod-core linker polypeptide [Elainellaceae cyanobacterium]